MIETKKPLKCLVIQLARLGDTLQSLMALRAAQQLYPHLEIHFLARERFADAVKRVPWMTGIYTLPSQEILEPLFIKPAANPEALEKLKAWIQPIQNQKWDLIINWTYSEASSYLAALIQAPLKLGYT